MGAGKLNEALKTTTCCLPNAGARVSGWGLLTSGTSRALRTMRYGDKHSSLGVRLIHGVSWQVAMNLVGRVGTFAIAIIQGRILGKAGYGELGMVFSTLTLFGLFSNAVGGQTCTKFIAEMRRSDPLRAGRIAALSLATTLIAAILAALVITAVSGTLATKVLRAPHLKPLLCLAAVSLALDAMMGTVSGILLGLQRFRADSALRLVQVAGWLILTSFWSPLWSVAGAMLAYTVSQVIALIVYSTSALRIYRNEKLQLHFSGMWSESRILLQYSLPLSFLACVCLSTVWIGNAILARQAGGYAALGGYVAAVQFRTVVLQLPLIMQGVVWPAMAELYGRREHARVGRLFRTVLALLWAIGVLAALFMIGLGNLPIAVFGRSFTPERGTMAAVMAATSLSLISSFAGIGLQVMNRIWFALYANIFYSAVSLGLSLLLAPRYAGLGLALAFLAGTFVQAITLLVMVHRFAPDLHENRNFVMAGLSVLLCTAVFLASQDNSLRGIAVRLGVGIACALVVWRSAVPETTRQFFQEYVPSLS